MTGQLDELDDATSRVLLRRQAELQAEAAQLVRELGLLTMLERAGRPEQIGSSVSGLMVHPDIDFNIRCPNPTPELVLATMAPLLARSETADARYRNETGAFTPEDLGGDERYYFVVHFRATGGRTWKLDFSFWLSDAPRPDVAFAEFLRRELTPEQTLAILWIKDMWHEDPTYPYQVGGYDIYQAVLHAGIRTPAQFASYLRASGLPTIERLLHH
jgi:hypothetical protein